MSKKELPDGSSDLDDIQYVQHRADQNNDNEGNAEILQDKTVDFLQPEF